MLFVPAGSNSFAAIQSSVGTARPNTAQGTLVTPVVGSKGAWAQVIASLDNDTYGLLICINSNTASTASRNTVVDIGIGTAGNELVMIPDLIAGNATAYLNGGLWYYFPVAIPAGTRIAARSQGTVTTGFRVYVQAVQRPFNPSMIKKASFVDAIGMTAPTGTSITPGISAKSPWVSLGTTSRRLWFWQLGAQVSSADTAHTAAVVHLDLAVGDETSFQTILQEVTLTTTTTEAANMTPSTIGCEFPVPAGSTMYARGFSSGGADPTFVTAYGAGG